MSKARRGTKANPFEVGERVVIRKVRWKGVVREKRGPNWHGAPIEYLVAHGHGPASWLEARYLEVDPTATCSTCLKSPCEAERASWTSHRGGGGPMVSCGDWTPRVTP